MSRTLTVVQVLPALNAGGVERSTLEIAAALVAAGHRSIVISAGGRLVATLLAQGSEHVQLDIGAKSLRTLVGIRRLRKILVQLQPDVVHARSRLPAWIAWFALRRLTPRPHFVTTVHGLNSPSRYSAIMTRGERVICVSNTVRTYVLGHYPNLDVARIRVIARGVDLLEFPRTFVASEAWRESFAQALPQLAGGQLLTLPGRGTRLKGHRDAIALTAALRARGIDGRLLLLGALQFGREAYAAELMRFAAELHVAQYVVMTPPRPDVREIYAVSDLILQLSTSPESFGRTVIEALAMGKPVLGYAHGGVGELLAECFPAGAVALRDATTLLERAESLLRDAPSVPLLEKYRLADMQSATLQVYQDVVTA